MFLIFRRLLELTEKVEFWIVSVNLVWEIGYLWWLILRLFLFILTLEKIWFGSFVARTNERIVGFARHYGSLCLAFESGAQLLQHVVLERLGYYVAFVFGEVRHVWRLFDKIELFVITLHTLVDWTMVSFVVMHTWLELVRFLNIVNRSIFYPSYHFLFCQSSFDSVNAKEFLKACWWHLLHFLISPLRILVHFFELVLRTHGLQLSHIQQLFKFVAFVAPHLYSFSNVIYGTFSFSDMHFSNQFTYSLIILEQFSDLFFIFWFLQWTCLLLFHYFVTSSSSGTSV